MIEKPECIKVEQLASDFREGKHLELDYYRKSEIDKYIDALRMETVEMVVDCFTRWRKVDEELPEEYTDVLFVDSDGTYYLGNMTLIPTDGINPAEQYWSGKGEPRCKNPKYWMPLPKAPEAK